MTSPGLTTLTPGGLPYPESTADLNQGANDIKALALALDQRGNGTLTQVGETSVAFNAAVGSVTFPTPFKAGTTPRVFAMGGSGSNQANKVLCCGLASITNTGFTLSAVKTYGNGQPSAFATGGEAFNIAWLAIGTSP